VQFAGKPRRMSIVVERDLAAHLHEPFFHRPLRPDAEKGGL
jgi:hypothetical protein